MAYLSGDREVIFSNIVNEVLEKVKGEGELDLVIGIPFYNEKERLRDVISIALDFLKEKRGIKGIVLCSGDPAGYDVHGAISNYGKGVFSFLMKSGVSGKGYSIRAIMQVAEALGADLILLEADLVSKEDGGFSPLWLEKLMEALSNGYDFNMGVFNRHPYEETNSSLFASPFLEAIYGVRLRDPLSGIYAFSNDFLKILLKETAKRIDFWHANASGYGILPWIVTRACTSKIRMAEVELGVKLEYHSFKKISYVFKEIAKAFFECAVLDEKYWLKRSRIFKYPDVFYGAEKNVLPEYPLNVWEIVSSFRKGFEYCSELYKKLLPNELWAYLYEISKRSLDDFEFDSEHFAESVFRLFLAYRFGDFVHKEDLKEALYVLYAGRLAAFIKEMEQIKGGFGDLDFEDRILDLSYSARRRSREAYLKFMGEFFALWNEYRCGKSVCELPQVESLEFIAGIPVVISKEITKRDGTKIYTGPVFKELVDAYKVSFYSFVERMFEGKKLTTKEDYLKAFDEILHSLNEKIENVFSGELSRKEDVEAFLKSLYKYAGPKKVTALRRDFIEKVLYSFPPENTLLRMGTPFVKEMLSMENPCLLFTYAVNGEDEGYLERLMTWMRDGLRIEALEEREPNIFVYGADIPHNVGWVEPINYEAFSGSIIASVLPKGTGGSYPKLYYFLNFLKALAEAEIYREMWALYKGEKKEFGRRVVNSCVKYSSWEAFSAKSVLENLKHQRVFEILNGLSQGFLEEGMEDIGVQLKKIIDGYFIGFNLKEGVFLPCSIYTWADYSFRGGKGIPTPFSVRVERDGFNTSLVVKLLKESGYEEDALKRGIYDLIGRNGHDIDVLSEFLYIEEHKEILLRQEAALWPAAGVLARYDGNPILKPIPEHYWESRYVLNCASVYIDGKIYLLYRAFGEDEVSRIGLAVLKDGFEVVERIDYPIFSPLEAYEKKGCEDPRAVILDGELFMFYTAYDGVTAQIAVASINVDKFLKKEFSWKRRGPVFPNIWNKDAALFPEKIGGKFYILHRLEPSIWMSCSEDLAFPWNDKEQKILISPRPGLWDSLKVGAGAQPLKTKYGWLIIYHGVDEMLVYRLGVLLLDLENPEIILYRSPNPILWPEASYEIGDQKSWVKNVVFTCGAVNLEGKEVLEDEDEIVVYYGASDTYICAAKCRISDLLPDAIRKL